MTALLREPLTVSMPAAAVSHVRLVPRWQRQYNVTDLGEVTDVIRLVPPLCHTRLPAFVCTCGERRLLLEWPDGRREWQTEDGRYVLEMPQYRVEYSDQGRRRRLLFLSADGPPRVVDHWTERTASNFFLREPVRFEPVRVDPLPGGQIGVTDGDGLRAMVEADTVEALVEYARAGNERDFRDLAAMSGVPLAQLDKLWQGTRARLR